MIPSVFPLMQFYFRAAKERSGSKNILQIECFRFSRLSYTVCSERWEGVQALWKPSKARLETEGQW